MSGSAPSPPRKDGTREGDTHTPPQNTWRGTRPRAPPGHAPPSHAPVVPHPHPTPPPVVCPPPSALTRPHRPAHPPRGPSHGRRHVAAGAGPGRGHVTRGRRRPAGAKKAPPALNAVSGGVGMRWGRGCPHKQSRWPELRGQITGEKFDNGKKPAKFYKTGRGASSQTAQLAETAQVGEPKTSKVEFFTFWSSVRVFNKVKNINLPTSGRQKVEVNSPMGIYVVRGKRRGSWEVGREREQIRRCEMFFTVSPHLIPELLRVPRGIQDWGLYTPNPTSREPRRNPPLHPPTNRIL